jgi:PAS domain-containing protein
MVAANKLASEEAHGNITSVFGIKSKIFWKNEQDLIDIVHECFETQKTFTIEREYFFRATQKTKIVSATYSFLPPDSVQIITVDITQQKFAERQLLDQKKLFETMFNAITDAVLITDTERNIMLANKGIEKTFGYQSEDVLGKKSEV